MRLRLSWAQPPECVPLRIATDRRRSIVQTEQTIQRRDFISQVAAGGAAGIVAAGPLQAFATATGSGDAAMFRLTVDDFAPLVGDKFELEGSENQCVSAKLVEAKSLRPAGPRPSQLPRSEAFSLVFQTDGGEQLVQETRAVRHPDLGTLSLLLVPVSPQGRRQRLEAIFN
jgi:hypothetical protein